MRRERTEEIIRKRVSVLYFALRMEKEVSRALSEALQDQIIKNNILEDMIAGMSKE